MKSAGSAARLIPRRLGRGDVKAQGAAAAAPTSSLGHSLWAKQLRACRLSSFITGGKA